MLMLSLILSTVPAQAADTQVCGIDAKTYDSAAAAETAGVDVSYNFACTTETNEAKLYEASADIRFAGTLVEVGSTDIPTTLILRNASGTDYTVEVNTKTILGPKKGEETKLSDWIPGDQIKLIGKRNENTENIEAITLVNLSIKAENNGVNGWITLIDKEKKEIKYKWADKEYSLKYNDKTRFVVGGINPASADDLKINDRIRGRLIREAGVSTAKIIVVLRRGEDLFMKIRTFRPNATLTRIDSTIIPTTIQVRLEATPGLKKGDVNNLVGTEGDLVTVNITENTKIVRKYFGQTNLDNFTIGDKLSIVGRANDDGTIDAKILKNNSLWKTNLLGHAGVVTEVNASENYLMMNWMPYKHVTKKQLKEKLSDTEVTAQTNSENKINATIEKVNGKTKTYLEKIKEKFQNAKEKVVGAIKRIVLTKKIAIDRIRHKEVKMKDLIKREDVKKIKVEIASTTKIIIGSNTNAALSDIQNGDKIRVRGVRQETTGKIIADTITVVNSIPEIEEDMDTLLDEINEVASEIITDDQDTTTDTEKEIEDNAPEDEDATDDTATGTEDVIDDTATTPTI